MSPAHVIIGNDVLIKCDIPSFVTDFVSVGSWVDSDGIEYRNNFNGKLIDSEILPLLFSKVVINSGYEIDVFKETVIRGNDALLKCQIPSFVSDFVHVEAWLDSEGNFFQINNNGTTRIHFA